MSQSLAGKVAIVTGASRGIGRAIAERLGRDGASIVVNYAARREHADAAVAAIEASGARAIAVQGDMGRLADIERLFGTAEEAFGQPHIVVSNAATSFFKPHAEVTEEDFDRMFGLNAKGVFFVLQQAARRVADNGRIINISSGGTAGSAPGGGLYTGSKAAGEQYVMALARELGPRGVAVNSVLPGLTDTEGVTLPREMLPQVIAMTPFGRLGQPADIADAVAFLAGDDARWITGQNIRVSGGL